MPIEVTVVDNRWDESSRGFSQIAGPYSYGVHYFDAYVTRMTSVRSMVDNVIGVTHGQAMNRLTIIDHGSPDDIQIGDDIVSMCSLSQFTPDLARLTAFFVPGAMVDLGHCRAGQNEPLMRALAGIWHVFVRAGIGAQDAFGNDHSLQPRRVCDYRGCWDDT